MKRKKVALYDPYLDTLGGGEKHVLSILKVLSEEGYDPTIFWNNNYSEKIKTSLNISFPTQLSFAHNIFSDQLTSQMDKIKQLSQYDIFIYVTDGSYFFTSAKKNFVFSMVPDKNLYPKSLSNRLKFLNMSFIANSQFTQRNLKKWGVKSEYIYPVLDQEYLSIDPSSMKKEKIILGVGRFFKHLHAKRQDVMIEMYKKLKEELTGLKDFKLILAGGLMEKDKQYFDELKEMIGSDSSIILRPNLSFAELLDLYKKSMIYWHFAGYQVNEDEHPELTEHLGITPLEAMSAGCIAFCYKAGGLKEIVQDSKTGFLFQTYDELKTQMDLLLSNKESPENIQVNAKKFISDNFSYEVFKEKIKKVML